jgi:OmpA-OmpF porin, OOP family
MSTLTSEHQAFLTQVISQIPESTQARFAGQLNLSQDDLRQGLNVSLGKLVTTMHERENEVGFAQSVTQLIPQMTATQATEQLHHFNPSKLIDDAFEQSAQQLLGRVFGTRLNSVVDGIAMTTQTTQPVATALLNIASAALLSCLGQNRQSGTGAIPGMGAVAANKRNSSVAAGAAAAPFGPQLADTPSTTQKRERKGGLMGWLLPILLAALAVWALANFWPKNTVAVKPATDTAVKYMSAESIKSFNNQDLGRLIAITLPNGVEMSIPENGIENQLLRFIQDPNRAVDKTTWFNFDRILFDSGKATIKNESNAQLDNMAVILQAYPAVNLKIGGYTDSSGNAALNKQLSADRAAAVTAHLTGLGVAANRLKAEGYGDQFPVASNDTSDGRAQNRRIAARVTQK